MQKDGFRGGSKNSLTGGGGVLGQNSSGGGGGGRVQVRGNYRESQRGS